MTNTWFPGTAGGDDALSGVVDLRPEYGAALRAVEAALWAQDAIDPITRSRFNGPLARASARNSPKFPAVTWADAWTSLLGARGMRFIAPPTAFRPYKVPCGPRSTSMRSRSRNRANAIAGRARYTPSR